MGTRRIYQIVQQISASTLNINNTRVYSSDNRQTSNFVLKNLLQLILLQVLLKY